jgi:four helix bundle protein
MKTIDDMTEENLNHEDLNLYKMPVQFVRWETILRSTITKTVCAMDHLERAAEGVPASIVQANTKSSPNDRRNQIGIAAGSALECAACLDILQIRSCIPNADAIAGKQQLVPIVSILIRMHQNAEHHAKRVRENTSEYSPNHNDRTPPMFSHEKMDLYIVSLEFVSWIQHTFTEYDLPARLEKSLDKFSTSIVLNMVEGNGRFLPGEKVRFFNLSRNAATQAASKCDVLAAGDRIPQDEIVEAKNLLRRIVSMLVALESSKIGK